MRKYVLILLLLCLHGMARGQTTDEGAVLETYYWFDDATTPVRTSAPQGVFEIDASSLSEGLHTFNCVVIQDDTLVSSPVNRLFIKVPMITEQSNMTCLFLIDGEQFQQENISGAGGVLNVELDLSSLSEGLHSLQAQVIDADGVQSKIYNAFFLRVMPEDREIRLCYTIDDSDETVDLGVVNGSTHFDIDMSSLEAGVHSINYVLNDGQSLVTRTSLFIKTPDGGNHVAKYQYWVNDRMSQMETVELQGNANPYNLVSMLPVESQPFRSSSFHFEINNDEAVIYAKNILTIRFYDALNWYTDAVADYVDYSVSRPVENVNVLESGVREVIERPAENTIRWFKMEAEKGDSLSFVVDRACTLQLFSPSSEEVYSASGNGVLKWNGCHAEENGTYYLAVHDMTATQSDVINLDYEHIDKYVVLRQDVSVVGNGGRSIITFDGNGFDELESVELILNENIIEAIEIGREDKGKTSVLFDFNGIALGQYQAIFHFLEDDVIVDNCITVEEPIEPEFHISASYARYFMGTENTYTFTIVNSGNMTAYEVPVGIYIYGTDSTFMDRIDVEGYNMRDYEEKIFADLYTDSLQSVLDELERKYGDKIYFYKYKENNNSYLYWANITPTLKPGENKINVTINLHDYLQYINVHDLITIMNASVYMSVLEKSDLVYSKPYIHNIGRKKDGCKPPTRPAYNQYAQDNPDWDGGYPPCPPPPSPPGGGGGSGNGKAQDPNDIFGYRALSTAKAVRDGLTDVYYTIEFENDSEFATAPAHDIYVTDELDATKFDLSTFAPTRIQIGNKSVNLDGTPNFVTTIDMRPDINAIAQVEGTYDQSTGVARWHISSLDPMTVEPTTDLWSGVLPINTDGKGIGEISFDIKLKDDLAHGTTVDNQAGIVFDTNEAIMTPIWTNTIDKIAPVSSVADVQTLNDTIATVQINATDELSGPWCYDVYVQYGQNANWFKAASAVPIDSIARVRVYEGINHGFYVVATDSAGNVELKDAEREFSLTFYNGLQGDVNGDDKVSISDAAAIVNYILGNSPANFVEGRADMNNDERITISDAAVLVNRILSSAANQIRRKENEYEPQ